MLKEVWDGTAQAASYNYNADSTIAAIKYGNGINIQYTHDADKNIAGILTRTKEGKELLNHSYVYDNNGNQVRKEEGKNVTSYAYDALNRLGKVVYPNQITEAFGYDKVGNRTKRTLDSQVTNYTYDSRNRLTSLITGEDVTTYKYDVQGNLLAEKSKQGATKYTYDCFNRTTSVQKQDGSYIKNFYDPEGLRSEINENGVVSKFVFDGGSVVTELDAEDKVKAGSIRGIELISQRDSKDNSYYYLNNYHGDVIGLTDTLGDIVNSYDYDAFGNTLEANEQVHNRFRYSGEQYDPVTSQYYLRARFYNPVVGRFMQEDEYRGDGLNLYAYVANNPVNYVDPSGYALDCEDKVEVYKRHPNAYKNAVEMDAAKKSSNYSGKNPNPSNPNMTKAEWKAKESNRRLIEQRANASGLDLTPKPAPYKSLGNKQIKRLQKKIDNRTITREEWNRYEWNKRLAKRRNKGVDKFWETEEGRIKNGTPTRNWNEEQVKDILSGQKPKFNGETIEAHHTYSVMKYPHLADKGEILYPATKGEHWNRWHGRAWSRSKAGEPYNPKFHEEF